MRFNPRILLLILFFVGLFGFSVWLMVHTLSYDSYRYSFLIGAKAWSDFGSMVPLVRSFSEGINWPPVHPLFPGETIKYHYLFYLVSGLLEHFGLRFDWAVNVGSILGFFSLTVLIFLLARKLFGSIWVGLVSVLLFLFNGSLSFVDYFNRFGFSYSSLQSLPSISVFPAFGPWNGSLVTAFWNLNIFTNQRHLGLGFAISLLILLIVFTSQGKRIYLTGFLLGSLLLINQAAFLVCLPFIAWNFIYAGKTRTRLLLSMFGAVPWVLLFFTTVAVSSSVSFKPGYLVPGGLTFPKVALFWFMNLGLHLFTIPIGFILSPRKVKLFLLPLLVIFIVPNLFRLSPDMINNHKFFNFFMLLGVMLTANFLVRLVRIGYFGKIVMPVLFFFLVLGGIVDFFPIKNDFYYHIGDVRANQDATFFKDKTPKDSVILNSTWFYHPASLAGRFVYNGYSYFTWSYGYDQVTREKSAIAIYQSATKPEACDRLKRAGIDYVELGENPENFIKPNRVLWRDDFTPVYIGDTGTKVFSVEENCTAYED